MKHGNPIMISGARVEPGGRGREDNGSCCAVVAEKVEVIMGSCSTRIFSGNEFLNYIYFNATRGGHDDIRASSRNLILYLMMNKTIDAVFQKSIL